MFSHICGAGCAGESPRYHMRARRKPPYRTVTRRYRQTRGSWLGLGNPGHQEKSSSQNSVVPRGEDGRAVSWSRSSTRRILPEMVLGRSANSIRRIRL